MINTSWVTSLPPARVRAILSEHLSTAWLDDKTFDGTVRDDTAELDHRRIGRVRPKAFFALSWRATDTGTNVVVNAHLNTLNIIALLCAAVFAAAVGLIRAGAPKAAIPPILMLTPIFVVSAVFFELQRRSTLKLLKSLLPPI
jgi:apolipoprotein N-acyltransferase